MPKQLPIRIPRFFEHVMKGNAVAKRKRNVWDELLEVGRRILKEIDDFLDPKARQPRKPAPVPVPVGRDRGNYGKEPLDRGEFGLPHSCTSSSCLGA